MLWQTCLSKSGENSENVFLGREWWEWWTTGHGESVFKSRMVIMMKMVRVMGTSGGLGWEADKLKCADLLPTPCQCDQRIISSCSPAYSRKHWVLDELQWSTTFLISGDVLSCSVRCHNIVSQHSQVTSGPSDILSPPRRQLMMEHCIHREELFIHNTMNIWPVHSILKTTTTIVLSNSS